MVLPIDSLKTNVNVHVMEGPLADRPAPDKVPGGDFYFATDTQQLFLSVRQDGVPPYWFLIGGAAGGNIIQFLKPVTGNDALDGLTPATAIKTLDEVKRRLPALNGGECRVFVIEPGTNVMPEDGIYVPIPINPQGESQFEGEGLVIDARGALVVTESRVVSGDDFFGGTITYGGAALPRDTLIKMTSGANAGRYGTIRSTVAGAPNVSTFSIGFFFSPILTNETFDVVEQGYVLDATNGGFFFGFPGLRQTFNLVATKVLGGFGFGARGLAWSTPLCVFNTQGAGLTMADRDGSWGIASLPPDLDDGSMSNAAIITFGRDGFGNGGSLNANVNAEVGVALQATDTLIVAERGCSLTLFPCSLVNSPVVHIQPTFTQLGGFAPFPGFDGDATGMIAGFLWNPDTESNIGFITAAIRLAGGGGTADPSGGTTLNVLRVENNQNDGVQLDAGVTANFFGVTTDPALPNVGTGLAVSRGGKAYYDAGTAIGPNPLTGAVDTTLDGDKYDWTGVGSISAQVLPAVALDGNGNILSKQAVIDSRGSVIALT